jgi:alpha-ketoglutarate-dependent taurine dioxygenase
MFYYIIFVLFIIKTTAFKLIEHPLEPRAGYIYGLKNINKLNRNIIEELKELFIEKPLLVLKDVDSPTPNQFIKFLSHFDEDCDYLAIKNPDKYPSRMLQPFDSFPNCKHVAPRGNAQIDNFYDIKNITVKPGEAFINNYVWHTDLLGHETKLPGVITGFYIVENPLIGGDTDFISGETIYENLNFNEKLTAQNMLIEINRLKFAIKKIETDYSGSNRLEHYEQYDAGYNRIPLIFAPYYKDESPSVLLLPSFFERVVGWSVEESREWIKQFMYKNVLPHRFSVQWKKGDLCVFNNRRFMHSSTPARNYLSFEDSSKRLLLQTFLPTKRPMYGIVPYFTDINAAMNTQWNKNEDNVILSQGEFFKYYGTKETDGNRYLIMK